jgi:hypothetical protein
MINIYNLRELSEEKNDNCHIQHQEWVIVRFLHFSFFFFRYRRSLHIYSWDEATCTFIHKYAQYFQHYFLRQKFFVLSFVRMNMHAFSHLVQMIIEKTILCDWMQSWDEQHRLKYMATIVTITLKKSKRKETTFFSHTIFIGSVCVERVPLVSMN